MGMIVLLGAVAVLGVAVGAVAVVLSILQKKIDVLEREIGVLREGRGVRAAYLPVSELDREVRSLEVPEEADVVGQWAEQMAAAGLRVDSSEVEAQRLMRLEAGL